MSEAARDFSEAFTLRGGGAALVRSIRPGDRERLQAAFRALDPESVYLRYFSYKHELSQAELDRLCGADFHERVVLVVTQATEAGEIIVGAGGYVAFTTTDGVRAAEVAFTVEEDVQGQGVSSKLIEALIGLARADGIARFDAEVLARNAPMLRVFEHCGLPMTASPGEDGVVDVRLALTPAAAPR